MLQRMLLGMVKGDLELLVRLAVKAGEYMDLFLGGGRGVFFLWVRCFIMVSFCVLQKLGWKFT